MDIYRRLKKDHEAASELFHRLDDCASRPAHERDQERSALFSSLCDELRAHMLAEQEVFYNALLERIDEQDLLLESFEEHTVVERMLEDIDGAGVRDRRFARRVSELEELVEEHVAQEEGVIFEAARKHFADGEARELGDRLDARKRRISSTEKEAT